MTERDKRGARNSEKRKAAARANGKLGGYPPDPTSATQLARKMAREEVLVAGRQAMTFLLVLMNDALKDEDGKKVPVPLEVRERAAGRVFGKGIPDELLIGGVEDAPVKLVDVLHWRDAEGQLHELDEEIPGPQTVQ